LITPGTQEHAMEDRDGYWKLAEIEQRFNQTAASVRTLASGWILGTLAGLGWLLEPSRSSGSWPVPLGLLLVTVCMLGVAGIATLWVLDQLVFHRLLDAVFLVGLRMEYGSSALPPIRHVMLKTMEGQGTHRWERLFYLAPILVFTLFSSAMLADGGPALFVAQDATMSQVARPLCIVLLVLQLAACAWVLMKQSATSLLDRAGWFGDPAFAAMLRAGRTAEVIARSHTPTIADTAMPAAPRTTELRQSS
jgi:hypothetical protein